MVAMSDDAESLPELSRMVRRLEANLTMSIAKVEQSVQSLNVVHQDVYAVDRQHTSDKFGEIDRRFTNLRTTCWALAALMVSALSIIVTVWLSR